MFCYNRNLNICWKKRWELLTKSSYIYIYSVYDKKTNNNAVESVTFSVDAFFTSRQNDVMLPPVFILRHILAHILKKTTNLKTVNKSALTERKRTFVERNM